MYVLGATGVDVRIKRIASLGFHVSQASMSTHKGLFQILNPFTSVLSSRGGSQDDEKMEEQYGCLDPDMAVLCRAFSPTLSPSVWFRDLGSACLFIHVGFWLQNGADKDLGSIVQAASRYLSTLSNQEPGFLARSKAAGLLLLE